MFRSEGQTVREILKYESWGRYPRLLPSVVTRINWQDEVARTLTREGPFLPYGLGRSYGDCCLNEHGHLLDTSGIDRILGFDPATGALQCEAGVTLAHILRLSVPKGWFLPVTPGTKFVTVGGAIANDVHGKNHHRAGTFGCHIDSFELVRSDGNTYYCSREHNTDLYRATIGGLGLTGVIVQATIRLKPIAACEIQAEAIPFVGLDEFLHLTGTSEAAGFEYTVAWIDCLSRKTRGIFHRGNHAKEGSLREPSRENGFSLPVNLPSLLLNRCTIRLMNSGYYHWNSHRPKIKLAGYDEFFYPLDSIQHWNRCYGKAGLVQYQCVVPESEVSTFELVLREIADGGTGSFLGVIKKFGKVPSPGLLSFPRPGLTLALDLPRREKTLRLLDRLDEMVLGSGGALYPAKDARMSSAVFRSSYPSLPAFLPFVDPKFSSSFWRRVVE